MWLVFCLFLFGVSRNCVVAEPKIFSFEDDRLRYERNRTEKQESNIIKSKCQNGYIEFYGKCRLMHN